MLHPLPIDLSRHLQGLALDCDTLILPVSNTPNVLHYDFDSRFLGCPRLTDMSVFELSGLAKLRRIGLVRVVNLTDQAISALADRHSTLERIHLSYCEHITVLAIHFLLQRLHKLTHLSLTGVPAFQRP